MELDVKEQTEKLEAEIAQLEQVKNNVVVAILKKAGALELLQSLTPEEKPAKVDKKE